MKCPNCGFENEGNFCASCGKPLPHSSQPLKPDIQPEINKQSVAPSDWTACCPVCHSRSLRFAVTKGLFGPGKVTSDYYCDNCQAYFGHKDGKYSLLNTTNKSSPVWNQHHKKLLRAEEWARITVGGQTDEEILDTKLTDIMAKVQNGDFNITIIGAQSSVILKRDEEIKLVIPSMTLMEPRSVRTSSGSYGGPSFRIAKGVSWRMGSFGSTSESHEEIKTLDTGVLTVTNQRVVFSGATRSSDIPVSKIVNIKTYTDGVEIQISNRARPQYFAGITPNLAKLTLGIDGSNVTTAFDGRWLTCIIEGSINQLSKKVPAK